MKHERRVFLICLALAAVLGIAAGLGLRLAEDFAAHECYESQIVWMHLNQEATDMFIDLRAGDFLQVDVRGGNGVRLAVLNAQGRVIPVIGGWAWATATGSYTLRFSGRPGSFSAVISRYRKME